MVRSLLEDTFELAVLAGVVAFIAMIARPLAGV